MLIHKKTLVIISVLSVGALLAYGITQTNQSFAQNQEPKEMTYSVDHLTPLQKKVTLQGGTERAFKNEYWDNKEEGIYVDIINGTPLFSSTDKFSSGTGWPSFSKPIDENFVKNEVDRKFGMLRTEVKAKETDSHLGHVFSDGPKDEGGLRYCINSASLRFVAKADLAAEGYDKYLSLFGE